MDRRAVLRVLAFGATGASGCLGGESLDSGGTTDDGGPTTDSTSTVQSPTTEVTTGRATEETTTADGCSKSVVADPRRHVHGDYGLRIVSEEDDPAVAVVGEHWRSTLDTDEMSEADEAFVADTDFEEFVVLVVQYTKRSGGHDLRVTDLGIDDETLRADVCVVTDGGTNDAPTANLFVRVPYPESPPSRATVTTRRRDEIITVTSE